MTQSGQVAAESRFPLSEGRADIGACARDVCSCPLWEVGPKGSNLSVPRWQMSQPFAGSNASRVNTSVRGGVVDLAARDADIHQIPVT